MAPASMHSRLAAKNCSAVTSMPYLAPMAGMVVLPSWPHIVRQSSNVAGMPMRPNTTTLRRAAMGLGVDEDAIAVEQDAVDSLGT